ncbi:MAG: outer membrane lipoprotein-sorting protein [Actinobacteria bacterium]|nr:outer membrane lipoprotein-sorting protein [Actinomycetota bacterium]
MRYFTLLVLILLNSSVIFSNSVNLTANEIMDQVDQRSVPDTMTAQIRLTLINKKNRKRVRHLMTYAKEIDQDDYQVLFFRSPADVKGTGFLTIDYNDPQRDNAQWLYLPALQKVKRIATTDQHRDFIGSDFSYADISGFELDDYQFNRLSDVTIKSKNMNTYQIEAVPNSDALIKSLGYQRVLLFVDSESLMIVRAIYYLNKRNHRKLFDVKKLEQIDGYWLATQLLMLSKEGSRTTHRSILVQDQIVLNQAIPDHFFTTQYLKERL